MATPKKGDWKRLKRLARYLGGRPRVVHKYERQARPEELEGLAGCRITGKSTSGRVLRRGGQYIKSWSRTQQCVTLSSAGAELVAMTKLIAGMIGLRQLSHEWGQAVVGRVYADSTAVLAIAKRKGCRKLRHINVGLLWVQEENAQGIIEFKKVEGKVNPADLMTKHVRPATLSDLCRILNTAWELGRAKTSLTVKE